MKQFGVNHVTLYMEWTKTFSKQQLVTAALLTFLVLVYFSAEYQLISFRGQHKIPANPSTFKVRFPHPGHIAGNLSHRGPFPAHPACRDYHKVQQSTGCQ